MSENDAKIKAMSQSTEGPQPYEIYRHYKTRGLYAIDEATLTPVVIYRSLQDKVVWARTLDNFLSPADTGEGTVPRFTRYF